MKLWRTRAPSPPKLIVWVKEFGEAEVVIGSQEATLVMAQIVTGGRAGEWIDVTDNWYGRVTVRVNDIVAARVETRG